MSYTTQATQEIQYHGKISGEKLKALEQQHGKVDVMEVPLNDEGTEIALGYFKKIDRQLMGAYLTAADPIQGKEIILNATWLDGDRRILDDDELFFSACQAANKMISFRRARLKKS